MKIIIANNKTCKITEADEQTLKDLKRLLSFKQVGVEYTSAFRNGWNGITYLLSKKNEFALGLLGKVKQFLEEREIPFTVEDIRQPVPLAPEMDISVRLAELNKIPRDYQRNIVEAAFECKLGIVRACTGSGKTLAIAMLTAKVNKPTNIYVISLDLLRQFHDLFSQIFDEPIGFIGNGVCDVQRINIVSVWTAARALGNKDPIPEEDNDFDKEDNVSNYTKIAECLKQARLHMFDECHTIIANSMRSIYAAINPEMIFGFSGTPYRDDGCDLLINSILGEQIIDVPASDLIKAKWLAQPIIKFARVPKTYIHTPSGNYQTVYKEYVVENDFRNNLVVEQTKELLDKKYQVLVLFKHLQHGKVLSELFEEHNIKHEYLSGSYSLEQRLEVKNKLLNKQANLVLASSIFDVGVDISTLSGLILAGGGKSSIKTLQRVGRIIRAYPGKQYAAVVDFYDDVKFLRNHSKIRHKIYQAENGFKLIIPKGLTKELVT